MKVLTHVRHVRRSLAQRWHRLGNRAGLPATVRIVLGADRSTAPLVATVQADYIRVHRTA